jgi:hypothetical protein
MNRGGGCEPAAKRESVERHETEPISPELVLVDPELAARARPEAVAGPQIPVVAAQPVWVGPTRPRPADPPPAAPREVAGQRGRWRWPRRLANVAVAVGCLAIAAAAFLPPRDAPRLGADVVSATAASPVADSRSRADPATDPRSQAVAPAPSRPLPTLVWRAMPDARYYLVEIYSGSQLIHSRSVGATRLDAPAWLPRGRYTWRVFAGLGQPRDRRVRGPLEDGWFVVGP